MKDVLGENRITDREQEAIRAFVKRLGTKFGDQVLSIQLFGSRARGEAQPDSDMDIVVIVDHLGPELRKSIRFMAVDVWLEYGIYISTRVWSLGHWRELERLQTNLYKILQQDGIELLASAAQL